MASRSLGTLTLDLVTKLGGFTKGLTQGERQLQSFEKKARKIGADIGRALTVGFTAFSGVAAIVVANTIAAEKAQAQLAAALKSTAGAAGLTQEQLNGMAGELSSLTTIEDDAITSAQALLLTFTKISGEIFPQAIRAAADMSTALGTDLQSAVTQLGKALNDPLKGISALGRAGVQFSADQKSMIEALVETGRTADAQKIILRELETQFGGSAVAARDTFGGALEALKNTVGNLLEGDAGGNGLNAAKTAVEALNTQFSSASVKSAFAAAIEEAANQLAGLVGWLVKWDNVAGRFLENANTSAALKGYSESLSGVAEEAQNLTEKIAQFEASGVTRIGFEDKETVIARMREQLAKKQAIVDHFNAQELQKQKAHVADVAEVARSSGVPMLSGETQVIGAGDGQFEFGIAPRGGSRTKEDVQTTSEYLAELKKLADEERAQAERWSQMTAQLDGPLAEAEHAHQVRLRDIEQAGKDAGASSEAIAAAKFKETQAHKDNVAEIERSLDPLGVLLEDMKFESDLLGKTNAQRIAEMELRRLGIKLTGEQAEATKAMLVAEVEAYEQRERAISAMDDFRNSFEDNVAGVLDGSKSIKDAFRDMVDDLIAQLARMAAQNFADSLFGQPGTAGSGGIGGALQSLFGAFTKREAGGPVMAGAPYLVGERGPELVIPSSSGTVIPAGKTAAMMGGGGTTVINVRGSTSRRSLDRIAIEQQRRQRRATGEFA